MLCPWATWVTPTGLTLKLFLPAEGQAQMCLNRIRIVTGMLLPDDQMANTESIPCVR